MNEDSPINCIAAGIFIADFSSGMNLRDLLIIYLACGAPFGVYYFLLNRNRTETKFLWLISLFRFVFWIPFACQMVVRTSFLTNLYNNGFDQTAESDLNIEREIEEIKKSFENNFSQSEFNYSIYDFRETFERFVGLSVEIRNYNGEIAPPESKIFQITDHSDPKLAEICLNRRNRKRLLFHQKLARRDFFEIFSKLFEKSPESQFLLEQAVKLADLVSDPEARRMFEKVSRESLQMQSKQNVRNPEKEIWNSEKHRPPTDTKISTNLQALTATANLSNKD